MYLFGGYAESPILKKTAAAFPQTSLTIAA